MFSPVFEQVMSSTGTNYQKLDAEQNKDLATQYNITGVPTLVFEKDGSVVHCHTGVMSRPQLEKTVQQFS
jgi:thioredoxin-like negative regulator of GroEL